MMSCQKWILEWGQSVTTEAILLLSMEALITWQDPHLATVGVAAESRNLQEREKMH